MITWMQTSLQKHYKWLFSILLVIIIIAFVFTIGASPGIGTRKAPKERDYFGYNINSQKDLEELFRNANISNLLNTGRNIPNNFLAERLALMRPPLLDMAQKYQIPGPNEYELEDFIKTKPVFLSSNGSFDEQKYKDFLEIIRRDPNLTEERVYDVLREDYMMEAVLTALTGPGYILPFEAALGLERQRTQWSVALATIDYSDLKSDVKGINDETLQTYFNQYKFNYATPERRKLSYALVDAKGYMKEVEPIEDDDLKTFYENNPNLFEALREGENKELPEFEAQKSKILAIYNKSQAQRLAMEAASDIALDLFNSGVKHNSAEFKEVLNQYDLNLREIPPFDMSSMPTDTPISQGRLNQVAFSLDSEHYYSDAIPTDTGAALLFFEGTQPIVVPEMEQIRDKLTERYINDQSLQLLSSRGKVLEKLLQKAVESGASFTSKAKEEGMAVQEFDNFKILEAPKELPKSLLTEVLVMNENDVSKFISQDDKGYILYIKKKTVPEVSEQDDEFKSTLVNLQTSTASAAAQAVLNAIITNAIPQEEGQEQ